MASGKVKKFCFTLNNYTQDEENEIYEFCELKAQFAVIGHETGENGTPHLQGFINLTKQVRFNAVKKVMPRAHLELAKGTDQQNLAYCTKQDKEPYILGEPQSSGKRNDLKKTCDKVKEGKPISQVALECPETFVKYSRGIKELAALIQKPRNVNDPPLRIWLYGKAGVGKTRLAYDVLKRNEIFIKDGTSWWSGYENQQCILVDDFDGHWPFRDLLRFLDRYPYKGQIKGGSVEINSPIIIITCEFPPQHFWQGNELDQVTRRLDHVEELVKT